MAIHPIEYRYGTEEMRRIWSEDFRFSCIVRGEAALAQALARHGLSRGRAADCTAAGTGRAARSRA